MPTYQYSCTECGHFLEQFQSFSDEALSVCPECDGKLRKVYNAVGVVFKGSGFYRNDSRGAEPAGASSPSEPAGTKGAAQAGTGSAGESGKGAGSDKAGSTSSGAASTAPATAKPAGNSNSAA